MLTKRRVFIVVFSFFVLISLSFWFSVKPSNDRGWTLDQAVLPYADFKNDLVTIYNIRNFTYESTSDFTSNYYDKTFDLSKIKSVDYVIEPFSGWDGPAHTFLTFGFEGDNYISISIEVRKEKEEEFSALKGLFKQFELMYVIADEKDVIKLRSNHRKDLVYVYPIKASTEKIRFLFVDMLGRANKLKAEPEFYNTLTSTCTSNIADHVNKISPKKIPSFTYKIILPGYSDKLVYDLGLIDTTLSFEAAREKYLINDKALKYSDSPDFSKKIRE